MIGSKRGRETRATFCGVLKLDWPACCLTARLMYLPYWNSPSFAVEAVTTGRRWAAVLDKVCCTHRAGDAGDGRVVAATRKPVGTGDNRARFSCGSYRSQLVVQRCRVDSLKADCSSDQQEEASCKRKFLFLEVRNECTN